MLSAVRLGLPSVSYYGARNVQFLDETPKAPVIFHFGTQDRSIPPEAVQPTAKSCRRWPLSSIRPTTPSTARSDMRMIQTAPPRAATHPDFFSEHLG